MCTKINSYLLTYFHFLFALGMLALITGIYTKYPGSQFD